MSVIFRIVYLILLNIGFIVLYKGHYLTISGRVVWLVIAILVLYDLYTVCDIIEEAKAVK